MTEHEKWELGGWDVTVRELSAGVYEIRAVSATAGTIVLTTDDPELGLRRLRAEAEDRAGTASSDRSCRCVYAIELWDAAAKSYADAHLQRHEVRAEGWEVVYRCPDTGATWLEDYPRSEEAWSRADASPKARRVVLSGREAALSG